MTLLLFRRSDRFKELFEASSELAGVQDSLAAHGFSTCLTDCALGAGKIIVPGHLAARVVIALAHKKYSIGYLTNARTVVVSQAWEPFLRCLVTHSLSSAL